MPFRVVESIATGDSLAGAFALGKKFRFRTGAGVGTEVTVTGLGCCDCCAVN
jgi:hypothetical protein